VIILLAMMRWIILPCITWPHFVHEITIEHSLSHLLVLAHFTMMTGSTRIEASFGLIEHLLLGLSSDSWKPFMNPWIIIGLKHYACLSGIHFVNAQRSVGSSSTIVGSSLFSHPVSHEECLICFLCAQHSIYSLRRRLTLRSSKLLSSCLMNERVS